MTLTVAVSEPLAAGLRLSLAPLDYALVIIYFIFVIGIGFALRRLVQTSTDFFLSGRSLPTWITGIAFISANLGAIEILSMAANGAEYGISTVHYYWIGAVPAMVFLGVVMMPFYYGSRVRSVPEYLLRRFDRKTHLVTALIFVVASVLIAGVNLYALAFVLESLLGIPLAIAIIASALFVLSYILLGGLSSAIYNEVMQFFVILLALIPVIIVVLKETGGIHGLFEQAGHAGSRLHPSVERHQSGRAQPVRRLDRHRLRPGLLPVVRLLDHELRRGPAGHVGQGRVLRAADADRRGLPEGDHPAGHGHPGHGRDPADPRPGYGRRPDRTTTPSRRCTTSTCPSACSGWR